MGRTIAKWAGVSLLLSSVLLAAPLHYWAFHFAGKWYVNAELEPEQRILRLHLTNAMTLVEIACLAWFPGLLLLYTAGYRRQLIGRLLIPAGLLLVPGAF